MTEPGGRGPEALAAQIQASFLQASCYRVSASGKRAELRMQLARGWSLVAARVGDALFERGVQTSSHSMEITHFHPDRVWYHASGWTYLRRSLPPTEVTSSDVFLDLGSGKGRMLLQAASRYDFRRVIGVEISASLNETARANLARLSPRRRARVELVTSDAAEYAIPDDVTVIYLYYPFVGETFTRVIANIVASLDRRPRRLRIVYTLPLLEQQLLSTGRFRRARTVRTVCQGYRQQIAVYESTGA